ncbi:Ribosome-binding protein 1, putative [Babesia ovata]|uniref:Ribosome-binding protein 1, putative n=1 Tax=Babesia ovata TaxID=189622 RepID=A0A2H6KG11_9APIC|nr:Ribosome-binding protein 1, putative [Babesia ovata]GBE61917.1 Ribosome-binding protein 1, putative [Babesia ovata]
MTGHGVPLDTLKQCLQFLMWLKNNGVKQGEVAEYLHGRIKNHFNSPFLSVENVEKGLSPFLTAVSNFYERLCYKAEAGSYGGRDAEDIANALLDCVPKFLAAIYYLWYCVDPSFVSLGGGGWQKDWPGYGERSWHGDWGGDLDSVFVSSVIGESAKRPENAANSLVLARTFCDIVLGETDKETGGKLIEALNAGLRQQVGSRDKSICWKELHSHCTKLRKKFYRLFGEKHFDFTGLSTDTGNLNKTELAKETANWIRQNVVNVRGHLNDIDTSDRVKHLGEYFTKNLFPYGFTIFNGTRFKMNPSDLQTLKKDWREVIEEFKKSNGDLNTLREILSGTYTASCPPPPPKKPEVPPAKKPEGNQDQGKKAEGAQNQGKKAEGAQNQGKKSEGAQNQGKKGEGAQNQGKKVEGSPPTPQVVKSALPPPPGAEGAPGPGGPKGGKGTPASPRPTTSPGGKPATPSTPGDAGPAGPTGPVDSVSPKSTVRIDSQTVQPPPQDPPVTPAQHPAASPTAVRTQSPDVAGSVSGLAGVQGTGQHGGHVVSQVSDPTSSSVVTVPVVTAAVGGGSGSEAGGGGGKGPPPAMPTSKPYEPQLNQTYYDNLEQRKTHDQNRILKAIERGQKILDEKAEEERRHQEDLKRRRHNANIAFANSFDGFKIGSSLEGNALPDVSALVAQKQKEAEERSIRRNIQFL